MAKGNPNLWKHGFKKGQSGNPDGMPKNLKSNMNWFKDFSFQLVRDNPEVFKKAALENPVDFMKMLVGMMPKEITGEDGGPITVKVINF